MNSKSQINWTLVISFIVLALTLNVDLYAANYTHRLTALEQQENVTGK